MITLKDDPAVIGPEMGLNTKVLAAPVDMLNALLVPTVEPVWTFITSPVIAWVIVPV